MYDTHATAIQREVEQHPSAFLDVLLFVLATIQEPLERVADGAMQDIRENGADSPHLWGMKRQGYQDSVAHYKALRVRCLSRKLSRNPMWREACMVDIVECIHGINLPKAGFVMQLAFGAVGCLDSHNLKRFGIDKKDVMISRAVRKAVTKVEKAHKYVATCDALGGVAYLWDTWCDYVAEQRPHVWENGDAVSAAHACAVDPF